MRGRDLAPFIVLASLIALPAPISAQQAQSPWPPPPGAQQPPAGWPAPPAPNQPAPPPKKKKIAKKKPPAQEPPDPRFEEEPGIQPADGPPAGPTPAPAPARPRAAAALLNIKCEGPFAKNTTFALLVKTFGARNVFSQGGPTTILFPNDPRRRVEITWRDSVARTRPSMILVEAQSTWRVRGFRLGDPMMQVEKVNGRPFRFAGFGGTPGGNARDWQGGKLDQLSGGCLLGMRFAPTAGSPPAAMSAVAGAGDFASDDPNVRAVRPAIIEMIIGYPE